MLRPSVRGKEIIEEKDPTKTPSDYRELRKEDLKKLVDLNIMPNLFTSTSTTKQFMAKYETGC